MEKQKLRIKSKEKSKSCLSFFLLAFGCLFSFGSTVQAQSFETLDSKFRMNFPKIIKELCYSGIEYSLDDTFEDKQTQYQETINCLFNDGEYQANKAINAKIKPYISADVHARNFSLPKIDKPEACSGKDLSSIQGTQTQTRGFVSLCEDVTDNVKESYSSCRVAETVLLEWCGYEKFLLAKTYDWESFRNENKGRYSSDAEAKLEFEKRRAIYKREQTWAKKSALQMLDHYRHFEQKYRKFAWLSLLEQEVYVFATKFGGIYNKIFTYVEKFVNAQNNS